MDNDIKFTIAKTMPTTLIDDGDYYARVDKIYQAETSFGVKIVIEWRTVNCDKYNGRVIFDNFFVGAVEEVARERAIKWFSIFCKQICGFKDGEEFDKSRAIGQEAILTIKNYDDKNGDKKSRIVARIPCRDINKEKHDNNGIIPSISTKELSRSDTSKIIDDEIPF